MIDGIKVIDIVRDEQLKRTYVTLEEKNDEFVKERIYALAPRDIRATETDEKNKPKYGLTRVLTLEEAIAGKEVNNNKLQTYIDFIDTGMKPTDAANISRSNEKISKYNVLTGIDEQGMPQSGASRVLTQDEAVFFVTDDTHCLTPSKLQDFISLVDDGVSMKDARTLLRRKSILNRYNELTKPNEQGKSQLGASRTLTADEAINFMQGHLNQSKVQNYIDLIDNGVDFETANIIAQSRPNVDMFLSYIQSDENGKPKSGLRRLLTKEEAVYAVHHKGNKNKLVYDFDSGIVTIEKKKRLDTSI